VRTITLLLTCLGLAAQLPGQPHRAAEFAQPMPMPGDRVEHSYAIYSLLLKSGPVEWRNAARRQWLIEDTTNAIPLGAPCHTASEVQTNPHVYGVKWRMSRLESQRSGFSEKENPLYRLETGPKHLPAEVLYDALSDCLPSLEK
jgi:hypothetical protein